MLNLKDVEKRIQKKWRKIQLLDRINEKNKNGKKYFVLDGPPYANNIPHVGNVRNTVYKDFCVRLSQMRGNSTLFQGGFDTHGLPVENMVEKKLGLKSKKDILKLGIANFTSECKGLATTNMNVWMDIYERMGAWYSWKEPYLTYNDTYIESAWWGFKKIYEKGLAYEGKKPVFWCPSCETALAGYEVTDSYKMLTDPVIYIKFKLKNKDEYFLVFTTTPWTLLSNVAIVAHPDEDYIKVETSKGVLILAKKRLDLLDELEIEYKILDEFLGKELEGVEYESLMDVPSQKEIAKNENSLKVYMSIPILKERVASKTAEKKGVAESGDVFEDFVSVEEGTGLVHCAPGHGKTDNELGKHYNLMEMSPLDDSCNFDELAGDFEGLFVKDADEKIINYLEDNELIVYHSKATHKYPVCWRCKSPLIFRMSTQWFIAITKIKDKLVKINEMDVKWMPEFARERFLNWVLNEEDWNVSRQRYWGIPMPVWKCECGEVKVIGSRDEIGVPDDFDLHNIAEVKLKCEKCGKKMSSIGDIFDVWYDAGCATWASLHYPFENKDVFDAYFPVARINEAIDQIRGWFNALMNCGVPVFDTTPYLSVSMTGWILDEKGEKMSKSIGNLVTADDCLNEVGADAFRFYEMWDSASYDTQKFSIFAIKKEVLRILNTLPNLANYLKWNYKDCSFNVSSLSKIEDQWIISKLNSLVKNFNEYIDEFEYHHAHREFASFIVNDVSRKYIQLVRDRVNFKDPEVCSVLFEILDKVCRLLAPSIPHLTDYIYLDIHNYFSNGKESVHLEEYPVAIDSLIDGSLEESFKIKETVVQEVLRRREEVGLSVRWPLPKVIINVPEAKRLDLLKEIIMREANSKDVVLEEGDFKVTLDTDLDDSLMKEGFSREIVRRVQGERKKLGLKKEDSIDFKLFTKMDFEGFEDYIQERVGADNFEIVKDNSRVDFEIKGKSFGIEINKK